VTSDEIVECVANRPWNHPSDEPERPPSTQVSRYTQRRFRAHRHRLHRTIRVRLHPNDRVDRRKVRVSRADGRPVVSLERGKAQGLPAVMAQNELNAPGAEAARAVIEEDGCRGGSMGQGSFHGGKKVDQCGTMKSAISRCLNPCPCTLFLVRPTVEGCSASGPETVARPRSRPSPTSQGQDPISLVSHLGPSGTPCAPSMGWAPSPVPSGTCRRGLSLQPIRSGTIRVPDCTSPCPCRAPPVGAAGRLC
jgi:hypothetical protein